MSGPPPPRRRHRQITVPANAAWFDASGFGVENHGVDPDIEVSRTPLDWEHGTSSQLEVAVATALDLLDRHPAAEPPDVADRPDLSRPRLPPR